VLNTHRLIRLTIICIILLAATWLRVGSLAALPPGMSSDESMNANDAFHIAKVGPLRFPFYENYGEPEPLFRFILSAVVPFFGPHIFIFRLVSAMLGVIAVAVCYWSACQLLAEQPSTVKWTAAALAAVALAIALGHITLTRGLYRAAPLPIFLLLFVGFLMRGLRRGGRLNFVISGLGLAMGYYTYTSAFIAPLALIPFAFSLLLFERPNWKRWLMGLATVGITVAIVTLPVAFLLVTSPERVLGRAAEVTSTSVTTASNAASTITGIIVDRGRDLLRNTFLVLFSSGDSNVQYNTASASVIPWIMQPLFAIGVIAMLVQWRRPRSWLLVALVFVTAAPAVLSNEVSHGLRLTGEFAIFPLVTGIGAAVLLAFVDRFQSQIRLIAYATLGLVALVGTVWSRQTYIGFWEQPSSLLIYGQDLTYGEWFFRPDQRDLALWLRAQNNPVLIPVNELLPQTTHAWLLPDYPNATATDENIVIPPDTIIALPWTLEHQDFNLDTRQFALLDNNTITLLPPLTNDAHAVLVNAFDSANLVTRPNGNPLAKVIMPTDTSAITFDAPQVAASVEQPIATLPNDLLVTGWWGPNTLTGTTEQTVTYAVNWATVQPQHHDHYSFVGLLTLNNERLAGVDAEMTRWLYPIWTWPPNTSVPVTYTFTVPAGLNPGAYRLAMIMYGNLNTIGWVKVPQDDPPNANAGALHPNASFNNQFLLEGVEASNEENGNIRLSLYWQSQVERSITDGIIFIHAQTKDGTLFAQVDGQPWGGQYPTFIWSKGERVKTDYTLNIGTTPAEEVEIWVGMYTFPELTRLEVTQSSLPVVDNRLNLGSLLALIGL
jgi:4-amino-4-deoxy-L-arabinose transferase-like glycosyltransferase